MVGKSLDTRLAPPAASPATRTGTPARPERTHLQALPNRRQKAAADPLHCVTNKRRWLTMSQCARANTRSRAGSTLPALAGALPLTDRFFQYDRASRCSNPHPKGCSLERTCSTRWHSTSSTESRDSPVAVRVSRRGSLPRSVFYNTLRVSRSVIQLKGRSSRARMQRLFPGTDGTPKPTEHSMEAKGAKTGVARHPLPHP
jgi:hypothetical protein